MKKMKILLPVAALFFAVALSAFTQPEKVDDKNQTTLYWFVDPAVASSYQGSNTQSAEEAATLCDSNQELCEVGFTSGQLIDPNDPEQGVDPDERNNGIEIHKR